jgi:hypothetical protein
VVVPESCRRLGLVEETADVAAIEGCTARQHFQGDDSLESLVERLGYDPHSTPTDFADDAVAADPLRTWRRRSDIGCYPVEAKQSLEAGAQPLGFIWMAGEHVIDRHDISPAEPLREAIDDGKQLLVSHSAHLL